MHWLKLLELFVKVLELIDKIMDTKLAKRVRDKWLVMPQRVRWTSADHSRGTGILVWAATEDTGGRTQHWISWDDLQAELTRALLPYLFANPKGYRFETRDHDEKQDWLVQVFDSQGTACAEVWFGVNPDNGWAQDGLIRIGTSSSEPHVWQVYQRLSNGTYERLTSLYRNLDTVPDELKRINIKK